jgi:hypothetical protein
MDKNSVLRGSAGTRLGAAVFVCCAVLNALADLTLGFVFEFLFFFLFLRQFFLTFLVSVIRCCQSMLSSYWGALYHFRALSHHG